MWPPQWAGRLVAGARGLLGGVGFVNRGDRLFVLCIVARLTRNWTRSPPSGPARHLLQCASALTRAGRSSRRDRRGIASGVVLAAVLWLLLATTRGSCRRTRAGGVLGTVGAAAQDGTSARTPRPPWRVAHDGRMAWLCMRYIDAPLRADAAAARPGYGIFTQYGVTKLSAR
jgi:hypothetical protein